MKRIITLIALFNTAIFAQDMHFSQFYMNPVYYNPACAGAFKDITVATDYKTQWASVSPNAYNTITLGGDMRVLQKKWKSGYLGIGLNIYKDQAGDGNLSNTIVDLSLAGHIKVDENQTLSAGIQGGVGQYSFNPNNLTWDNNYNQSTGVITPGLGTSMEKFANQSYLYPDAGAGVLYHYKKGEMYVSGNDNLDANIGFSVAHVNEPLLSFYSTSNDKLYMKYTVHGSILIGLKNTPLSLVPGFLYDRQGGAQEIVAGSLVRYTLKEDSKYTGYVKGAAIALGAYYRWDDAVIISSLMEFSNYAIGVSYDVNVSPLVSASSARGGLEVTLRYVNPSNFLYQNKARF